MCLRLSQLYPFVLHLTVRIHLRVLSSRVCSDKQAREARGILAYILQHTAQSDGAEEVGYCEGACVWL